ncbi:MAG: pyridoxamine 5'-phosphate oxidase family protein [Helicobacteraceae bacterium]|nr:pyridoxamine 5'-phosphate oxidase family protein [Helicobacteraceae bacterium]
MFEYGNFFTQNKNGVMGTVDSGKARTRTFQVLWTEDNRLYFCTGNHKPVYKQMKANPNVSFTALNVRTMESVSVCGTAVFVDDKEGKKRALDENSGIKEIYKTPDNPAFELLYLEVSDVSAFTFSNSK